MCGVVTSGFFFLFVDVLVVAVEKPCAVTALGTHP